MAHMAAQCLAFSLLFVGMHVNAAELAAHWPMDEVKDGQLADVSGKGHDGTLFGKEAPAQVEGIVGKALEFTPEAEGGFTIADSAALNLPEGLTVMAWVKPGERTSTGEIVCLKGDKSGDPPWPGWRLRFFWTRVAFEFGTEDGRECRANSPEWSVPVGYWSHVAATYDGAAIRIYVNAVLTAEEAVEGTMAPQQRQGVLANYMGRKNAYPFDGILDEVKVFAGALPEEAIFREARDRPE